MTVYDVATKVLDTELFPPHNIADLISGITFIVLLSQEKPLRWKEINTHTHTHTHTHTTHTHTHTQFASSVDSAKWADYDIHEKCIQPPIVKDTNSLLSLLRNKLNTLDMQIYTMNLNIIATSGFNLRSNVC